MANPKHLEILARGQKAWNKWREEHRTIIPDLSRGNFFQGNYSLHDFSNANLEYSMFISAETIEANFNGANLNNSCFSWANANRATFNYATLREAELDQVDFEEAWFKDANLQGAKLEKSFLCMAHFEGANLSQSDLGQADLSYTRLVKSNLSRADLSTTNLMMARIIEADMSNAILNQTIFGDATLTNVKGLDTCQHVGPSVLDHSTIEKSTKLPLSFLRGCGLPDTLIEYLPFLLNDPIQFYSCFISYSSKDQNFAERLHADLQNKGVRCWYAPEDLKIGDKIRVGIDESIRVHDKLLLILSKNSIESEWVEKEVETAMERERQQKRTILFPIRLDDMPLEIESGWVADIRRSRNIGDFRRWKRHNTYSIAFERLLRDLKADV